MTKKRFLSPLLIALILISLLAITPDYAHAAWFGEKSFAATFASFFSKVRSFITNTLTPKATAPAVVQATCIPPVPAKPAGIDSGSKYSSLNITPEVSTADPGNIVTISLNSDLEEVKSVSIYTPFPADLDDYVVDWYPKKAPDVSFSQANYSGNGEFRWGLSYITGKYQKYNYGVRIRMQDATIQKQAKNTTNADGWRKISYTVSGLKPGRIPTVEKGSKGFYVGREQKPSLITTIGKDNFKDTFYSGSPSLKPFTVVPDGYFEIQTKSLGQPGTITMKVKNAKIIGGEKRDVKADEIVTWKIQPIGKDPVRLLGLSLTNACGEDHFVDPAKSARLADFDKFTFPVVYDAQVSVPAVVPKKSEPQQKPPTPTIKPAPSEQSKKIFPQNLVISPNRSLDSLREGDQVTFTAKLVMSDGSTQIAKTGVKWTLIGQVGNITPTGVFTAKLDEAVAEYGESSGIITATYVDANGASFIGKTPTFRVEAFMLDGGEGEG